MGAGFIGYVLGLFVMAVACTGIIQFVLVRIPGFKKRLGLTYIIACLLGIALLTSSESENAVLMAGFGLVASMFLLYKRDVTKRNAVV